MVLQAFGKCSLLRSDTSWVLQLPEGHERPRLRTTFSKALFPAPFNDLIRRRGLASEFSPTAVARDMETPGRVTPEAPFEPSQPPVIEGFSPSVYSTSESFKEKFIRKTRENPLVPIGKQVGAVGTVDQEDSDAEGMK